MLNSLDIRNYRNLKELKINSLGRVNLVTGKNNTGKSTLLEAIAIYATGGDLRLIYQLLEERGETFRQRNINTNSTETNVKILSSLFNNWDIAFDVSDAISIGSIENTLFGEELSLVDCVSLRFVRYIDETQIDEQGNRARKRRFLNNDFELFDNYEIGLEVESKGGSYILPLVDEKPYRFGVREFNKNNNVQLVRTRNINKGINGSLFDNIALTNKEQYVIEALRIIEQLTERIAFIEESPRERSAVIKLLNSQQVLPLQSMGDGINRVLTIILALVNSDNGYLLIDEFENGLHYSVQEKLWEIIFQLSKRLNIQVFVTTHSNDCIKGFENVLNKQDDLSAGKLIRLDNKNGVIKQIEFDANELKIANSQNIEIR